jgi:ribosomal protein S14
MLRAEHRSGNRVSAERNWFGSVEPMAEIVEHGGMYQVEIYGRIRRAVLVEGRSQRSVAREFGLTRVTVRKMVGYSIPPGYRRKEPPKRPKLGP